MRHALRWSTLVGLIVLCALVVQTQRNQAADPPSAEVVAELVAQLDAPQKAARDEAEKKLIALGPAVVDRLPKLGPDASAEVETRLSRVRMAHYRARAEASVSATTVTLAVKDAPLENLLADIEKQTKNHLVDFRERFGQEAKPITITLDAGKQPFWKTIDALTAQAGMEVYHFSGEDGLAFVAAPHAAAPAKDSVVKAVSYSDAFRIEAKRVTAIRSPASAEPGELRVELEVAWEPRLKPLFLTSRMSKVEARDDQGATIEPGNAELAAEIPPQGKSCRAEVVLPFIAPPRASQSIKTLKGTFEVLIPAEHHTFRFAKLDDSGKQEQKAAAVTVSIEEPRKNGDLVQIALTLKYDNPANALESHRAWFYKNPCYLLAADGTKTPPGTIELTRQSDDSLSLNLLFAPEEDWSKQTLIYQAPADIVSLPVTYQFSDLPLP
jgi:hypothetical protein